MAVADPGGDSNIRVLSNGDVFTGECGNGDFALPNALGKYVWTDGCMYDGEWSKGKPNGKGVFSWPSGATYEGVFRDSFMDGKGVFTGSYGDTYRGNWVMNLKHGHGTESYANGDSYDGQWLRGFADGHGRYHWKNANHYIGHWKKGFFNGNGTMIWSDGNRYDGFWEDGFPKGNGTFRWMDGSFYVGIWSRNPKEQSGSFYPSGFASGSFDWDPMEVFTKDLNECRTCPTEIVAVFPSQKFLNWPGTEAECLQKQSFWRSGDGSSRTRRRPSDACALWEGCENGDDSWSGDSQEFKIHSMKRQGETISKGHKNYDLMLNLQLGIRHSVGRPAPTTSLDLKAAAFDPREKVWTRFPPGGSKYTPPHQSCDFRWKDYCPLVFRSLRKLLKVDAADYMLSICGNDALRELSSPGKSGSFFYLTHDDRYMIKTMKKSEVKVLLRMLPAYYEHVRSFENTLVTKFFGLHCVKLTGATQKKVRFVIMGNLFCSGYSIHRRYDLKGSSHGRTTDKPFAQIEATTTLKDLDLNFLFRLHKSGFQEFCSQVDKDCDFLEQERIMDYSLLVGLHFRETMPSVSLSETHTPSFSTSTASTSSSPALPSPNENGESEIEVAAPRVSRADIDQLLSDSGRWEGIRLGIEMPAWAEKTIRRCNYESQMIIREPTEEFYYVIIFFGIIDILQDYDISKKLEHAYKSFQYDPTSISAVDPKQYSKRFRDFIFKVFTDDS